MKGFRSWVSGFRSGESAPEGLQKFLAHVGVRLICMIRKIMYLDPLFRETSNLWELEVFRREAAQVLLPGGGRRDSGFRSGFPILHTYACTHARSQVKTCVMSMVSKTSGVFLI